MNFHLFPEGETITLLPQRLLYLRQHRALVVADVHFGKINHFRKAGIAVPAKANNRNAADLIDAINQTKPERVVFLGDLFHSTYNEEWETVGQITDHFRQCSFELVVGNHDILSENQYSRHSIHRIDQLVLAQWLLTHEPLTDIPENYYNLAGHIHPGIRLHGSGRQSLVLPCFYFGKRQGLLPAFGTFTGLAKIKPQKEDKVFVLAEGKIIQV